LLRYCYRSNKILLLLLLPSLDGLAIVAVVVVAVVVVMVVDVDVDVSGGLGRGGGGGRWAWGSFGVRRITYSCELAILSRSIDRLTLLLLLLHRVGLCGVGLWGVGPAWK